MSKIQKIINKLCPNSVTIEKLGHVVKILDNLRRPISKNKRKAGDIPYYGANGIVGYINNFIFDGIYLLVGEDGSVINKDKSPVLNWTVGKIWVNNHAHVLSEIPEIANLRYVYYYLQTADVSDVVRGVPPKINQENLKNIKLPIPPLSIQQEIVKILDNFTQLGTELEAELEARRKQYEYYRDTLLTFKDQRARVMTLGDLGTFVRGSGLQKKDFVDSGVGCIHYGQIYTHYETYAYKTKSFVTKEFAAKLRKASTGNLVIATTSENDEDLCKAVAWLGKEEIAVSGDALIYRHSLNPKYLSYFFQSEHFQIQKRPYITGTKVRRVSGEALGKIKMAIPSLEEQERIVSILDKFDTLVNDLSEGLPAEIKARRQQYEHYRDQLLTFKKTV